MNPEQLLSQLRDVQSPPEISWWPPAPGWWLLAIILLVVAVWLIRRWRDWRSKTAWRRIALSELNNLKARWQANPEPEILTDLVILLKRSYASALARPEIKSEIGEQWRATLKQAGKSAPNEQDLALFTEAHYKPDAVTLDLATFKAAEGLIRGLRSK